MAADFGFPVPPAAPRITVRRWLIHGAALLATLVTTTYFGGWHYVGFLADFGQHPPALTQSDAAFWLGGLWFSLPVLAILGVHEAGHYVACRYHRVDATLPLFLPAPLPLTGTFGAVIRIKDVIPHTRALFDIGAAGPFAGFVVAVPVLVAGLALSHPTAVPEHGDLLALGEPPLYRLLQWLLWGTVPDGQQLHLHPTALAAWFGLLATALNLFPLAQLDGGHIAYAVFGPRSRWITVASAVGVVGLTFLSASWIAWAAVIAVVLVSAGPSHPPTLDDSMPLGAARARLAVAAAVIFVLCFTSVPVQLVEDLVRTSPLAPH